MKHNDSNDHNESEENIPSMQQPGKQNILTNNKLAKLWPNQKQPNKSQDRGSAKAPESAQGRGA